MIEWFKDNAPSIQAISAVAQLFFSLALIAVGVVQWRIYRKQASIMSGQLKALTDLERNRGRSPGNQAGVAA